MPKKRRVPEVLWRLFRNRAMTLANGVVCLISQCSGGQDVMSYLLRPDDPADYRTLLNHSFVVINIDAPPIGRHDPANRWPQKQIVERTMEMIMRDKLASSNVICSDFDKCTHSSPIVELLTSSAWSLLLSRVGDAIMIYLLKHTTIILPLPRKKYHQVAGPPICNLVLKSSKHTAKSEHQPPSLAQSGPLKGSIIHENTNSACKRQWRCSFGADVSVSCVGSNSRNCTVPFCQFLNKSQTKYFKQDAIETRTGVKKGHHQVNDELEVLCETSVKPKKRSRPFKWQRIKKHRRLDIKETSDEAYYLMNCNSAGSLQHYSVENPNHCHEKKCSAFHVFQAPDSLSKRIWINRRPIFYNLEHSPFVLPRKHELNYLKPNFAGSKSLIESIFHFSETNVSASPMPCPMSSSFCPIGSTCLYHSFVKLFKIIIRRAQHCKHLRLLDKHCSVSSLKDNNLKNCSSLLEGNNLERQPKRVFHCIDIEHGKGMFVNNNSQVEETKAFCSKNQVISFVWAACRSVVPPDLLGTPSSCRILRRNISKFIRLRRFEKFSLKQCMHKLKTSGFPFLSDKHSPFYLGVWIWHFELNKNGKEELSEVNSAAFNLKQVLLKRWIFWFFTFLVVPLIQANFYATEIEHGKNDVYYYHKSIWEKLHNRAIFNMKSHNYRPLDILDVETIVGKRSFGFSKLRLRPKENGVRMLANLKASSWIPAQDSPKVCSLGMLKKAQRNLGTVKSKNFKSVNYVLRDTYAVLKGIKLKEPENLGASVFDYNDIYKKLCPFITSLKNGSTTIPDVFVVVSDVSKAFDSIDQDKLLDVMKDVLHEDEYHLKQYYQVVCTKKSLWVHENLMLTDPCIGKGITEFSSLLSSPLHAVIVNQGQDKHLKRRQLLYILNEHVKRNIVQLDKGFYLQDLGISQGSVLSSLLCSFYYGHLERNVIFSFLEGTAGPLTCDLTKVISSPSSILLRLIDDFLFISTSKKQAASFFFMLQRGFQGYNCHMNEGKYCLNFDIENGPEPPSNRIYVGDDGVSFLRWSGLFLNSCTLEVQADYTRYLDNHMSSALTVCWQDKPAHQLKMKLCDFVRPKCHPIFFDSNINSGPVVRLNIYQVFLVCAMKFHCYVSDMSYICKLRPGCLLRIIQKSFRYMYALIKKRMYAAMYLGSGLHPVLELLKEEVEWLGLDAYIHVLRRKQSRHRELLSLLKSKWSTRRIDATVSPQLKYAVEKSHSSLIWRIKY
ncbi:hypothetical protein K2173_023088 [Erythroxylum novogranatense]|uniref:Telomerase reverse transcriptase n=1 Tax=Erythroxylum novogranatense TaxID=1862640 RepID=A0AAV8TA71_9ROSI|nr:hypothetical protein K2173_023088 [Erythroxylum novogranatense]